MKEMVKLELFQNTMNTVSKVVTQFQMQVLVTEDLESFINVKACKDDKHSYYYDGAWHIVCHILDEMGEVKKVEFGIPWMNKNELNKLFKSNNIPAVTYLKAEELTVIDDQHN